MSERFRLPLPERIPTNFGPITVTLVLVTLAWAFLSSGKEPEGCYRIDATTHLAIADGEVHLISKRPDQASIMEIDRVRGFVLKLDRNLVFDPHGWLDTHFKEAGNLPGSQTLFINEQFGETPHILFRTDDSEQVKFYEFVCDPRTNVLR